MTSSVQVLSRHYIEQYRQHGLHALKAGQMGIVEKAVLETDMFDVKLVRDLARHRIKEDQPARANRLLGILWDKGEAEGQDIYDLFKTMPSDSASFSDADKKLEGIVKSAYDFHDSDPQVIDALNRVLAGKSQLGSDDADYMKSLCNQSAAQSGAIQKYFHYLNSLKTEAALNTSRKLLFDYPDYFEGNPEALRRIASVHDEEKNYKLALEFYAKAEDLTNELGPKKELSNRILRILQLQGKEANSTPIIDKYLQIYPNDPEMMIYVLQIAITTRAGDDVINEIVNVIGSEQPPEYMLDLHKQLYDMYLTDKKRPEAIRTLNSIRTIVKENASIATGREEVKKVYKRFLAEFSSDAQILCDFGDFLFAEEQDIDAAFIQYKRLARDFPQHENLPDRLQRVIRENPNQPGGESRETDIGAHYLLADYNFRTGDAQEAYVAIQIASEKMGQKPADEMKPVDHDNKTKMQNLEIEILKQLLKDDPHNKEYCLRIADLYCAQGLYGAYGKKHAINYYGDLLKRLDRKKETSLAMKCCHGYLNCMVRTGKEYVQSGLRFVEHRLGDLNKLEVDDDNDELLENIAKGWHYLSWLEDVPEGTRKNHRERALALYQKLELGGYINPTKPWRIDILNDLENNTNVIIDAFDYVDKYVKEKDLKGAIQTPLPSPPKGNTIFDGTNYEQVRLISEAGAFGNVYLAMSKKENNRYVAIKALKKEIVDNNPEAEEKFRLESDILKKLKHPNIVTCYESTRVQGQQYIVMEYVEGGDLEQLVRERGAALSVAKSLELFAKICSAVEYFHNFSEGGLIKQGLFHRDLHPKNILLGGGDIENVKVTDFGLATLLNEQGQTKSTRLEGAQFYVAPEIYDEKPATRKTEVYSLAKIFLFMLFGKTIQDISGIARLRLDCHPDVEDKIKELARRATGAEDQRPAAVRELLQAVKDIVYGYDDYEHVRPTISEAYANLDPIGQALETRYEIVEELTQRGLKHALDKQEEIDVAIKEIDSEDPEAHGIIARFHRLSEIQELHHENIVEIHRWGRIENGTKYIVVMEYVPGKGLDTILADFRNASQTLPLPTALEITRQVGHGLQCAHGAGIIHRCVKPSNIIVNVETEKAKLSDFSVAVVLNRERLIRTTKLLNQNCYMAPEIFEREDHNQQVDIYSLGVVLNQMLTGEIIVDHASLGSAYPARGLPGELSNFVRTCTSAEPSERFETIEEMLDALSGIPTEGFEQSSWDSIMGA